MLHRRFMVWMYFMNAADSYIVAHVRLAQSTFHIGKNQVNDPKIRTRLGVMSSNLSMFH